MRVYGFGYRVAKKITSTINNLIFGSGSNTARFGTGANTKKFGG